VWLPTDWTPRQRVTALISLIFLAFACAMTACTIVFWGRGPLALDTFIPIGVTLLTLGATLLTSVYWYAYRHAHNTTGNEPSAAHGMLIFAGIVASMTFVFQVIAGGVIATGEGGVWQVSGAMSYGPPAYIGGLVLFVLGMTTFTLKWRPTRDPSEPENRLAAPVTGARLLFRSAVMLLARHSWVMIWGVLVFESDMSNRVIHNLHVDTGKPITIFWCGAAFFLIAAVIELLPSRPLPVVIP
jgi:hypothetical protein